MIQLYGNKATFVFTVKPLLSSMIFLNIDLIPTHSPCWCHPLSFPVWRATAMRNKVVGIRKRLCMHTPVWRVGAVQQMELMEPSSHTHLFHLAVLVAKAWLCGTGVWVLAPSPYWKWKKMQIQPVEFFPLSLPQASSFTTRQPHPAGLTPNFTLWIPHPVL